MRYFLFFLFILASEFSFAATFSVAKSKYCSVVMNGEVELGDNEKLKAHLEKFPVHNPAICLNSPGGNYDEGIRLAQTIHKGRVATVVLAGSQCYSTCAIMFMFGTNWALQLRRRVEVGAALGFHAPYIGAVGAEENKGLFDHGVAAVRKIYELLYLEPDPSKSSFLRAHVDRIFPPELMVRMLLKKPNELMIMKTVNDIGRYGIALIKDSFEFKKLPAAEQKWAWGQACRNLDFWKRRQNSDRFTDDQYMFPPHMKVKHEIRKLKHPSINDGKEVEIPWSAAAFFGHGPDLTQPCVVVWEYFARDIIYNFIIPELGTDDFYYDNGFAPNTGTDESWMTLDPSTVICDEHCQKTRPFVNVK